jgi:hypothetical protein
VRDSVRRETGRKRRPPVSSLVEDGSEDATSRFLSGRALDIGPHRLITSSRRSIAARFLDGRWILRDLDSTNRNGHLRIQKPQPQKIAAAASGAGGVTVSDRERRERALGMP